MAEAATRSPEAARSFSPEPPLTAAATLIYDGDCEFCRRCAEAARRRLGSKVEVLAYQEADLAVIGLTAGQAQDAAWWISESGERFGGHRCVAKVLIEAEGAWGLLGRMLEWPLISQVAGGVYRLVSRNRHRLGCSGCIKKRQRGGRSAAARPRFGKAQRKKSRIIGSQG